MKELKDILHLYLGCEVMFENEIFTALECYGQIVYSEYADESGEGVYEISDCKLILRPLSNMIEEELTASKFSTHPKYWHNKPEEYHFTPIAMKYLLSKHFDLFGLIEAGLAIDKTTLK